MKKLISIILIVLILGCTAQPVLPISERSFSIGIAGYTPRNHPDSSDQDWVDFFAEVKDLGELFGVYALYYDANVVDLAYQADLGEIVLALGYDISSAESINFTNYQDWVLYWTELYHPKYLALGVEVNNLYVQFPDVFDDFVAFYRETYDLIKQASPETKVFTIFQLDVMRGEAYLTGLNLTSHWSIIDLFKDKLDLVSFTVYPFLNYNSVSEIPDNYFTEIKEHTGDLPIAFTEFGWPSDLSLVDSSEIEQVVFFNRMLEETQDLNMEFIMCPFLHDGYFPVYIFETVGLKNNDGMPKEVYNYWKTLEELPLITHV
ncbi:MAG: hypothetical protein JW791_05480 [Nanoarchaeota archaeon]|nr:hypothetical protein [Nanoarchaeota archaeon]